MDASSFWLGRRVLMTTISWQDAITNVVTVIGGGGTCLFAAAWLVKAVITDRLKVNADTEIERVKNALERDVEAFKIRLKADADAEIERLRHFLSSRISKIHEKEFDILPNAWLKLNDLHGSVALALDLTFKTYPDFRMLSEAEFEEF
jgi:hypothetical protein